MLNAGCTYDLLGRFSIIINHHKLNEQMIYTLDRLNGAIKSGYFVFIAPLFLLRFTNP